MYVHGRRVILEPTGYNGASYNMVNEGRVKSVRLQLLRRGVIDISDIYTMS
jgi:hypothetical protein